MQSETLGTKEARGRMPTLDFKGKQHIYAHHLSVPYRPLVADGARSVAADAAAADGNLIIHGDNLHALKALLPRYAGRVDCVYIDPPYNTGNEGWTYNDNVNSPLMCEWIKANSPVDGEDLERHDKWLCMMWPRLQLHKELLSDDGAIFVSIDYNEEHHLRMLMDEIFGEENYRNSIVVSRVKKNIRQREKVRALNFGYNSVLFYSRSEKTLIIPAMKFQEKPSRWHAFDAPGIRPSMEYEIFGVKPPRGRHWMYSEDITRGLIDEGKIRPNPRTGKPQYFLEHSNQTMLDTNWTDLQESDSKFDFPNGEKNVELIKRLVGMVAGENSIVLDSFAGSGTTAHAVLALNKEDGGSRRFILVECEDYADSITAERVRRAIGGVPGARDESLREGLGGSFAYCELGEPIDAEMMLTAESLPSRAALAAYLLHVSSGVSSDGADFAADDGDGGANAPFYRDEKTDYYLLYRPDREWLRGNDGMLSEDRARRIAAAAGESGRKAVVFAPGKYMGQRDLTRMGITFCQLPYEIYRAPG